MKNNNCRQSYKNPTKQVRIDAGLYKLLKIRAIEEETTCKSLLEDCLMVFLAVDNNGEYGKRK